MVTYRIKVRKTTYLWGGSGITDNISSQLYLFIRVEDTGERVRFGTRQRDGRMTEKGVLDPGEAFTLRLNDISGVWATIAEPEDTYVECAVLVPAND
jgi:hypothetical protein